MDSNENETQVGSTYGSEKKDLGWKYARSLNEKYLNKNTVIYIFCDKVTKGGIYKHKQHLVGGHRIAKKCRKCLKHVSIRDGRVYEW